MKHLILILLIGCSTSYTPAPRNVWLYSPTRPKITEPAPGGRKYDTIIRTRCQVADFPNDPLGKKFRRYHFRTVYEVSDTTNYYKNDPNRKRVETSHLFEPWESME